MFTRNITLKFKRGSASELGRIIENNVLPLLRKQRGFRDETAFVSPERSEALIISFWDAKEDEELYNRTGHAAVLRALEKVLEGTPTVETFELSASTFPRVAAQNA